MASKRHAQVDRRDCVSCGTCEYLCPKGAIKVWHGCWAVVDTALCVGCGKCATSCPANCISIVKRETAGEKEVV